MISPRRGFLHVFFAAAPETFTYEREKMFFSLTKDERRASSSQPAVSTIRGFKADDDMQDLTLIHAN
jgi:hypothetical protein